MDRVAGELQRRQDGKVKTRYVRGGWKKPEEPRQRRREKKLELELEKEEQLPASSLPVKHKTVR